MGLVQHIYYNKIMYYPFPLIFNDSFISVYRLLKQYFSYIMSWTLLIINLTTYP